MATTAVAVPAASVPVTRVATSEIAGDGVRDRHAKTHV